MNRYSLSLALLAFAYATAPAFAAQQQTAPATQQKRWTNADMARLRGEGLISIAGPETTAAPLTGSETAPASPAPAANPAYTSRLEDPAWYAEQASRLQAEMASREAALARAQTNLDNASNLRSTTGGINVADTDTRGTTPQEVIGFLEAEVSQTLQQLDQLADLARHSDINPGALRNTSA